MKRIFGKLLIAMALAAVNPWAGMAQEYVNTPVTVSKDKVRINGELCYSHVVLEKQTLFSISKAYNVSVDEIYRLNPSVKDNGLKKNAIILIPVTQDKTKEVSMQENALKIQQERVERQRQLDSLTAIEVQKPAKKAAQETIHVRKWFEDLNSIAEKYGVTVEAIMRANNLKSPKLSNRQRLVIPVVEDVDEAPEHTEDNALAEEIVQDSTVTDIPVEDLWQTTLTPRETVKATMLLPLKTADGRINRNNMDFYSGALLATYDMAEKGVSTEFSMLDIADKTHPVRFEDIEGSDMVIGPVSGSDISRLLESFPPSTMVISPLSISSAALSIRHFNIYLLKVQSKFLLNR